MIPAVALVEIKDFRETFHAWHIDRSLIQKFFTATSSLFIPRTRVEDTIHIIADNRKFSCQLKPVVHHLHIGRQFTSTIPALRVICKARIFCSKNRVSRTKNIGNAHAANALIRSSIFRFASKGPEINPHNACSCIQTISRSPG
jgi:hypothetical protein